MANERSENLMDCRSCSRTVDCDAEFSYRFVNNDPELFVCSEVCEQEWLADHTYTEE
jgi:hypothetical protein